MSREEIFVGDKSTLETFRGFAEKTRNPRKFMPAKIYAFKVKHKANQPLNGVKSLP